MIEMTNYNLNPVEKISSNQFNLIEASKSLYKLIFELINEDRDNHSISDIISMSEERFFLSFDANETQRNEIIQRVKSEMFELGPLKNLLSDKSISEIMINSFDKIFIEQEGKIIKTDLSFFSKETFLNTIERMVSFKGDRIDESLPFLDTMLDDGSRLNIIIPPACRKSPHLTIRKFNNQKFDFSGLVKSSFIPEEIAPFLTELVKQQRNILISGNTGSGKTTLLNALSEFINPSHRIITIEDSPELEIKNEHLISLQSRRPNIEGNGEITIRDLLKNALRMRPDRIIVGECRGVETLDMLQAMSTGHNGSMSTIHSNGAKDTLKRIEAIILLSQNLNPRGLKEYISSSIDYIIHTERNGNGKRRLSEIIEINGMEDDVIICSNIFINDVFTPELSMKLQN